MKDKKLLFVVVIITIFLLSIGLTYAYFNVTTTVIGEREEITTSGGTLSILYTDGPEIIANHIQPGWTIAKTIKVENNGTLQVDYSINWASLTNEITNDELLISGICISNVSSCENIDSQPISLDTIKSNINIEPGEEHTYTLNFLFIDTGSAQNYNQGKAFNGVINIVESADTFMLLGTLLDSNGDPIGGATVELHSDVRYGKTDSNGKFSIADVVHGDHEIIVKDSGNVSLATDTISIVPGSEESVTGKEITSNSKNNVINVEIKLGASDVSQITSTGSWYDNCASNSTNLKCKMIQAEKDNSLDAYADNVSSPFVTNSNGIDFTKTNDGCWTDAADTWDTTCGTANSNGKGLYYTTDKTKTEFGERVYYYRGAVTNNYLIFGGYCWRIVRTVEDGSTKLRYGGVPNAGVCPQTGEDVRAAQTVYGNIDNDNAYVGYMHGNEGTTTLSNERYYYIYDSDTIYFGESYTYDSVNRKYALSGDIDTMLGSDIVAGCTTGNCPIITTHPYVYKETGYGKFALIKANSYTYESEHNFYFRGNYIYLSSEFYSQAHANTVDTGIKKVVDAWYSGGTTSGKECYQLSWPYDNSNCDFSTLTTKLSDYSSLIANTPYCADRSVSSGGTWWGDDFGELGYGDNNTLFGVMARLFRDGEDWSNVNSNPTYKCAQKNDEFTLKVASGGVAGYGNNALTYPVGLITSDEVVYAGGLGYTENATFYMNTDEDYWTMTPTYYDWGSPDLSIVYGSGSVELNYGIQGDAGVIPVISLKSIATVSSGNGTYNSPYLIQ